MELSPGGERIAGVAHCKQCAAPAGRALPVVPIHALRQVPGPRRLLLRAQPRQPPLHREHKLHQPSLWMPPCPRHLVGGRRGSQARMVGEIGESESPLRAV